MLDAALVGLAFDMEYNPAGLRIPPGGAIAPNRCRIGMKLGDRLWGRDARKSQNQK